ncbi:uncharacterized protein LOC113160291 [Anabas testudineus]|uniref:uncharacterized protein LOC113160291 n=1 Tax=Anabas testudineus TaxID=64144 RepID=UPI000E465EF0|nr:uncharacterized protein LOC113160291 [Anabas testudineus]
METGEMERFNKRTGNLRTHHDKCERRFEKAQEDLCSKHEEMEPQLLSSSNSGSDEDYYPSQLPTQSSDEDEVVPEMSGSSGHSDLEKDFPLSSEHKVIKGQATTTSIQTTEQSKIRKKNNPQITVKTIKKKDGGRVWHKTHYCLYCKEANLKIARHLQRKHKDETDVAYAISFPPGSKQRKTLIESLRNKGDWQHNVKVFEEGDGEIVTWKRPSKKVSVKDYLPCQHCYAMFKRTELWRHEKSCGSRKGVSEKGKRRRVQKVSSQLIPTTKSSEGIQTVIHTMQQDHVTSHIKSESASAHTTMEQRRWNIQECVSLTEDVITLQNYLRKIEDGAKAELSKHASTATYKMLSESLLAQIIVFNNKREGEASRLTLETYLNADTGPVNKDIYETLTPVEKQLSHRLTQIVTRGKRGRKVPILLLERTKSSLDFLITKRSQVSVTEKNQFLFARFATATNIRGCDCLRKYAAESKVINPKLLTSAKLRKHVATLSQLLELDIKELEQVARFIGHDIRVHCDYYHQTDKTFQVAKIGKLLFATEHGAGLLKGKSLKPLDSVAFGKGHDGTSNKGSPAVKERETSAADRLPDTELPSQSSACQQMTLTDRQDNEDNSLTDGGEQEQTPTIPPVEGQKKTAKRKHCEDVIYKAGDEEESPCETTKPDIKRQKKTKRKYVDDDDDNYGDVDKGVPKVKGTRPWSEEERTAVQRCMAKFVDMERRKVLCKQ